VASERSHALGHQLRERRRSLRLTQDELADLAGCSPRFVRALETGKPSVRLDKVLDVLDVLGLDLLLAPAAST
jgi:y4mF family transcriptional regulator